MKLVIISILVMLGTFHLSRGKFTQDRFYNKVVWSTPTVPTRGVTIQVNTSLAPDLVEFGVKIKNILEKWYVPIKDLLISDEFQEIDQIRLNFDPNFQGVAYSIWELKMITASADYYRQNPRDIGSLIHELVHVIQQYPLGSKENCPLWLIEGIADWVRYYVYEPTDKPSKPWNNEHRTNGYRVAAYFLDYLNRKGTVNNNGKKPNTKMVSWLSKSCRLGKYRNKVFKRKLGKSVDQFWKEMMTEEIPFSVKVDANQPPELKEFGKKVKITLEQWYPYFAKMLNTSEFQSVDKITISFVSTLRGAMGYHSLKQKKIVGAADYFRINQDLGFWVKSMIHIVQQYRGNTCPHWVKSGIADWAWYWHVEPHRRHGKPMFGKSYKQGWWVAAYFMNWMNERNQPEGKNITFWLNKRCRDGTFNEGDFKKWTGKSAEEMWQEMMMMRD